ncbi:PREDICTED: riboflavin biosynthesis protein PYRR, chloroplastic-like [Amphimedon queenslandica]|uniref:NADAR domain-containing protein n=1 Tax=Amphimedon queenslandica TaxID=400682 RepID=A0AAN0IN87_AMPQE|nr:PREDICTED: riboflavin biosynthesis protein PYRR, chloroplastic-like [Amphimedon queenslandica]|eukprot:XP_011404489.1 PREDICTED: riboflavin biosynthesis protein PYRR, chloroplastic-like [Amphimedon queenslandica]
MATRSKHSSKHSGSYLQQRLKSGYTPSCGIPKFKELSPATSKSPNYSERKPLKGVHSLLSPANCIRFYHSYEPYYEFTNFFLQPVKIDGVIWPTTEHYFQAQKFIGTPYCEVIRKLPTPREAFQYSRMPEVSRWQRRDWASVKEDVMFKALANKFMQNERLKIKLLETKDCKLIEHTYRDSYWGDGGDGSGLNRLGELLMELRSILQYKEEAESRRRLPSSSRLRRSSSFSGNIDRLHLSRDTSATNRLSCTDDMHLQSSRLPFHSQPTPAVQISRITGSSVNYNIFTGTPI